MKQGSKAAFLVLIFLMVGCSDGPLIPNLEPDSLRIVLPPAGEFRSPSSLVKFSVDEVSVDAEWTSFQGELTNDQGVVLAVWSGNRGTTDPSLQLPAQFQNTPEGSLMTLEIKLYLKEQEVASRSWEFFYVKDLPAVNVSAQPLEAWPGSRVLLELLGTPPWGQETWVRWKWKNRTLSTGPWAENPKMRWDIPETEGSYLLTAEIFPRIPRLGDFTFSSPLVVSVPVVSTQREQYQPNELQPDSSYLYLYHFRGNLRNSGFSQGDLTLPSSKAIDVDRSSGVFGYAFAPGSELRRKGTVLPTDSQGELEPFSLSFSGLALKGGQVFSLTDETKNFLLTLTLEEAQWRLDVQIGGQKQFYVIPQEAGGPFHQTISFLPRNDGGDLLWYSQAEVVNSASWTWDQPPKISSQGELRLGGEQSFRGLFDEWGLYYKDKNGRPSTDGTLLARHRILTSPGTLLWAAGFDGTYLDEGFLLSPGAGLQLGLVKLQGDAWIRTKVLESSEGAYLLEIKGSGAGILGLQQQWADGTLEDLGEVNWQSESGGVILLMGTQSPVPDNWKDLPVIRLNPSQQDFYIRLQTQGDSEVTLDSLIYSRLPNLEREENTPSS